VSVVAEAVTAALPEAGVADDVDGVEVLLRQPAASIAVTIASASSEVLIVLILSMTLSALLLLLSRGTCAARTASMTFAVVLRRGGSGNQDRLRRRG
jgi:hypothetical protein